MIQVSQQLLEIAPAVLLIYEHFSGTIFSQIKVKVHLEFETESTHFLQKLIIVSY